MQKDFSRNAIVFLNVRFVFVAVTKAKKRKKMTDPPEIGTYILGGGKKIQKIRENKSNVI